MIHARLRERSSATRCLATICLATTAVLTLASTMASNAQATVFEWVLFKDHAYTQTANNVRPTTVDVYDFEAILLTDPGDFASVDLIGPGGSVPFTEFAPGEWEIFSDFGTQAALDAAFPSLPSAYTISTSGGLLGSLSESVTLGPDRYPTLAPYLNGDSFNDLSSFDVSQDLSINFGQPDPGDTQITAFSLYIVDEGTDTDVFEYHEFGTGPFSGSVLLPGGTLNPLTNYSVEMEFSTAVSDAPDGFAGVSSSPISETNFAALTSLGFETAASSVPEPSTIALGLLGGLGLCGFGLCRRLAR